MKKHTKSVILAFLTASLVAGCGKEPPKCSDEASFALIKQIVFKQLDKFNGISDQDVLNSLKIEVSRANGYDEKIKKYSCEAKLIAGGTVEMPISYESQLDDKNQHVVAVAGISNRDLLALQYGIRESYNKANQAKETVAQPVSTATQAPPSEPTKSPETPVSKSFAPSFDCAKATTFSEKAICTNNTLGKLDGALSENYKLMLAADIGDAAKSNLKEAQKKWLVERNACGSEECLTDLYRKRVSSVCESTAITTQLLKCNRAEDVK